MAFTHPALRRALDETIQTAIPASDEKTVQAWLATRPARETIHVALTLAVSQRPAALLELFLEQGDHGLDPVRQDWLRLGAHHGLGMDLPLLWGGTDKEVDQHRCSVFRYALRDDRHGPTAVALAHALTQTTPARAEARAAHLLQAASIAATYDAWAALLPLIQAPGFPCVTEGLAGDFWESLNALGLEAPVMHQDVFLAVGPASALPDLIAAQRARQRAQGLARHKPSGPSSRRPRV